jgi:hypothetical protein
MKNYLQTDKLKMRGVHLTRRCPNPYCTVPGGREVALQEGGLTSLPWTCPGDCPYSTQSQQKWMQAESAQSILNRLAQANDDSEIESVFQEIFSSNSEHACECEQPCQCQDCQCDH